MRAAKAADAWYRAPVLWLGALVFIASLAGCLWLIVVAVRNDDPPLAGTGASVLQVPLEHPRPQHPDAAQGSR